MERRGTIRIGISGWTYRPWRGGFYPQDLPRGRELAYAAVRFRAWAEGGEPDDGERIPGRTRHRAVGRDVFVFFDNDARVRTQGDAADLVERLGVDRNGPGR